MDEAFSELSVECNPKNAGRALCLISAPSEEMNMDSIKELGEYLREIASEAIIRNGDYPWERGLMDVVVGGQADRLNLYYEELSLHKVSKKLLTTSGYMKKFICQMKLVLNITFYSRIPN